MEDAAPSESVRGIRGLVYSVPGNSPVPNALLRFFEIPHDGRPRSSIDPEWIVRQGVPVGSALSDEKGQFALSYQRPNQDTSLVFVAFGPETGKRCDVLSWSFQPRVVSTPEETFLIGVEEARLARAQTEEPSDVLKKLIKEARDRTAAALTPPKIPAAGQKPLKVNWSLRSGFEEIKSLHGKHVDLDGDPDAARKLNKQLLKESYDAHLTKAKRRFAGVARPAGTSNRGQVDKKLQKQGKVNLGLAAENLHSQVTSIVDRVRSLIAARRVRILAAAAEEKKPVALLRASTAEKQVRGLQTQPQKTRPKKARPQKARPKKARSRNTPVTSRSARKPKTGKRK